MPRLPWDLTPRSSFAGIRFTSELGLGIRVSGFAELPSLSFMVSGGEKELGGIWDLADLSNSLVGPVAAGVN